MLKGNIEKLKINNKDIVKRKQEKISRYYIKHGYKLKGE